VVSCGVGYCLPVTSKVGDIWPGSTASFSAVEASSSGTKLLGVDFANYDVALETAWDWGTNTRNMTIAVNGGTAKRWAFPISGGDWYTTGRLLIEVEGFVEGSTNTVVFGATDDYWAPDLVGFEVFE
jgi:alpha-galactosidase